MDGSKSPLLDCSHAPKCFPTRIATRETSETLWHEEDLTGIRIFHFAARSESIHIDITAI